MSKSRTAHKFQIPARRNRNGRSFAAAFVLTAFSTQAIALPVSVSSTADAGVGTFRAAVAEANTNPAIDTIEFDAALSVNLLSDVTYTGTQDLTVLGNGSTLSGVDGTEAATWDGGLFSSNSAAAISLYNLTFESSFNNGVGILIPASASGEVVVSLHEVNIIDSRFHGLYIDGQETNDYNTDDVPHPHCDDPHPYDSKAGIELTIAHSTIDGNGTLDTGTWGGVAGTWPLPEPIYDDEDDLVGLTGCPADFDGVRLDDGAQGGIWAFIENSSVSGNLADGIEYDERGIGDVVSWAFDLVVLANGETSAYEIYDPENDETISDLDDGFDIDEAGNGELFAWFDGLIVSGNRDEGLDLDEGDNGSATVVVADCEANGNEDQGIKVDESGSGSLSVYIDSCHVNDSLSQNGIEFTEEDMGSLYAEIANSLVTGNDDAAVAGEQTSKGNGLIRVSDSDLKGNGDPSFDLTDIDVEMINTLTDD